MLLLNVHVFAGQSDEPSSVDKFHGDSLSDHFHYRFNLSFGAGCSYGLAGIAASCDFNNRFGLELVLGLSRFPLGISVLYEFPVDDIPLVICPRVSAYIIDMIPYTDHKIKPELLMNPGLGVGVDFKTYFNRNWFVNNTLGVEYNFKNWDFSDGEFLPHTGISIGYTFNGQSSKHRWIKDQQVSSTGLALFNISIGFLCSIFVPLVMWISYFPF
ncbi:MAG: hypothetical protein GX640_22595 [Fibrobacter sp.]|nr:hypothetical protein [Fibrobacter sp.]